MPTLFSACARISVAPSCSASSIARPPQPTAAATSLGEHPQLGHVAVGHRELGAPGEGLEQLDRGARLGLGGRVVAGEPGEAREPAARVALAQAVAAGAVLGQRLAARLDRLGDRGLSGSTRRRRRSSSAARSSAGSASAYAQRAGELGRRLAVRAPSAAARSPAAGANSQHGAAVAGRLGVVGEPRGVGPPAGRGGRARRGRAGGARSAGRASSASSTATRAISCRKATRVALGAEHARRAGTPRGRSRSPPASASSSHSSVRGGTIATASSSARAPAGEPRRAREHRVAHAGRERGAARRRAPR